jgi:hypothetical protein
LVSHVCQFAAYPAAKQSKTQLVVLQFGFHFKAQLMSYIYVYRFLEDPKVSAQL